MTGQLRVSSYNECPPGQWTYTIPDLPDLSESECRVGPVTSIEQCVSETMKRYAANARLAPLDLKDKIEHQNCQRLPPGFCHYENGLSNARPYRLTVAELLTGTITVGMWLLTGRKLVCQSQADARARVCASCSAYNQKPEGCAGCRLGDIVATVTGIIKDHHTIADDQLHGCLVCKCHQRVKVWAPLDVLTRFMSKEKRSEFPEWCWLKTESKEATT